LEQFVELVLDDPSVGGHLAIDLGMLRGLAYYNGIVFEVRHENWPTALGGGGRYDALASALGSRNSVPALGFAYSLEVLLSLTAGDGEIDEPEGNAIAALITGDGSTNNNAALRTVHEMRRNGETVELDVIGLDLEGCLAYARSKGIPRVVVAGPDGNLTEHPVTSGKSA
jgi:histidyl-tRNA synthetase